MCRWNVFDCISKPMFKLRGGVVPSDGWVVIMCGLRGGDLLREHRSIGNDSMPGWELLHWRLRCDGDMCRRIVFECICKPMHELRGGHLPGDFVFKSMHELRGGHVSTDNWIVILCKLRRGVILR